MVAARNIQSQPFGLVVSGEADAWQRALEQIVGPQWLTTIPVRGDRDLEAALRSGQADAAVIDEEVEWGLDVLQVLRMIRRVNRQIPVVVVARHADRRLLESALRLAAFSVVTKPLELEELLRQLQRLMVRLNWMLRGGPEW
jgi:DNA-binding NtrC family response regulator